MSIRRIALVVLLAAAPAPAQIDHRVRQGEPMPGHALDANPQVGSGGFNLDRPGFTTINSANAIVSGNVSGLGGFHGGPFGGSGLGVSQFNVTGLSGLGSSTISDSSLFGAPLPSSDLSYFNRRSTSVADLLAPGGGAAGSPYFGPSETVLSVGAIQRGLNRPGTSMVQNPYLPVSPTLFGTATPAPLPTGIPDPTDVRTSVVNPLENSLAGTVQRPLDAPLDLPTFQQPYLGAMDSGLFGPSTFDARPSPELFGTGGSAARVGVAQPPDATALPPPAIPGWEGEVPAEPQREGAAPAEPQFAGETPADPQSPPIVPGPIPIPGQPLAEVEFGTFAGQPDAPAGAASTEGLTPGNLGVDVFADLFGAVRQAEEIEPDFRSLVDPMADWPAPAPEEGAASTERLTEGAASAEPQAPLAGAATAEFHAAAAAEDPERARFAERLERAARWAQDVLERPITTFVGSGDNVLNRYMREAEDALHAGDYYRAAARFGLAAVIDPENPLPLLGRGHALAAAGDYISAVDSLARGIERFPDIVEFRLDLVALVGRADAFDLRRADLERRLSLGDSHELRFLLGYLEYYSGLTKFGLENLKKAAAAAPPESIIARFPALLTNRPEAPASPADPSVKLLPGSPKPPPG